MRAGIGPAYYPVELIPPTVHVARPQVERGNQMDENEKYKQRFMARIIEKIDDGNTPQDTLDDIAKSEYEGQLDTDAGHIDDRSDPEGDADECLSYWDDGEG